MPCITPRLHTANEISMRLENGSCRAEASAVMVLAENRHHVAHSETATTNLSNGSLVVFLHINIYESE